MKNIGDILASLTIVDQKGSLEGMIKNIEQDSRRSTNSDLFVAIRGTKVDGHQFLDVVEAKVIICETLPEHLRNQITYCVVPDTREAWARVSAAYYDHPAEKLTLVGVTGTNGKTSVATILHRLFSDMQIKSGLISTIHIKIDQESVPATHTTPDPKVIHQLFHKMWEAGCTHCFMEVSSHALVQHRVSGISFKMGIFTNITHDHLDYHGTFATYIKAKKLLFDNLGSDSIALINIDDRNGRVMVQNSKAKVRTFAVKRVADYQAKVLENTLEGLRLQIQQYDIWFQLLGSFNAYNLLTAYAVAVELGFSEAEILTVLSSQTGIPGRFQVVRTPASHVVGIVDYAHTPDALQNVLQTLKDIHGKTGKILTVVGCGGDRDKAKRPVMGKVASLHSDNVILTSDNPRSEDPGQIIDEMFEGIPSEKRKQVLKITDRREAIRTACMIAQEIDVVLIAGKGHETYQEIKGQRYDFDDRAVLRETLEALK